MAAAIFDGSVPQAVGEDEKTRIGLFSRKCVVAIFRRTAASIS
jgi:hypothetical protein